SLPGVDLHGDKNRNRERNPPYRPQERRGFFAGRISATPVLQTLLTADLIGSTALIAGWHDAAAARSHLAERLRGASTAWRASAP
ncbi:MAG: hypothetical protein ABI460_12495, partial [Caldimonas sp.]